MGRLNCVQSPPGTSYAPEVVYGQPKRLDRAEVLARKAVRPCEDLMAGKQKVFPYRLQGVQAYVLLAQLARSSQKNAEAARASGRAVELLDGVMRDYPA